MRALYTIATDYMYRRDMLSGAFGRYLVDGTFFIVSSPQTEPDITLEYRHARKTLGDVSDEVPYDLLPFQHHIAFKVLTESINNLPIVCSRCELVNPKELNNS